MVTLLGFFFIVGNVILLEIVMPDLVGPVCQEFYERLRGSSLHTEASSRLPRGCTSALRLGCGCEGKVM